jgi:hypothetical protein
MSGRLDGVVAGTVFGGERVQIGARMGNGAENFPALGRVRGLSPVIEKMGFVENPVTNC